MGTNYYLVHKDNFCEHCHRFDEERLHIGKSSAGWCFSLHVNDEITSLDDWKKKFSEAEQIIVNEYGDILSVEEMLTKITKRSWKRNKNEAPYLYSSWDEFHQKHHSEFGPNGLVRAKIDGIRCIGHGEGTWDLITGEFS